MLKAKGVRRRAELGLVVQNRLRRVLWAVIRSVFILGFSFVILYPIVNMITHMVMLPTDLYDSSVLWVPKHFSLATIEVVAEGLEYGRSFWNTFYLSVVTTVLQLCSCMMAGYAFARYRFPGRTLLFVGVIATLVIPPQLIMVSSYLNFRYFTFFGILNLFGHEGIMLLNTQWPQILLALTGNGIRNGLFIYLFRQCFKSMPRETEEAAMVDGAGHFRIFGQIMVPGAMTVGVTVALFSFVWQWNDTFYTALYNRNFFNLATALDLANFSDIAKQHIAYNGVSFNTKNLQNR